ncbi:MAG: response regulator [Tepidisphaeraceae bacterium]|jgi:two-component system response regulator (stage 0 sporulation protein F)
MNKPIDILLVDDETNIRLMLRTALKSEGYTTREAGNGREALDAIEREMPDVMILDLSMPVLDGMGVLRELKELGRGDKPRVIVLTAYGSIPAAVQATRLGAMDFIEKPVSPDEVRESVKAVLAEPAPELTIPIVGDASAGGYAAVLNGAREALRAGNLPLAETLLIKAEDLGHEDEAYYNLVGVYHEVRRRWRLARKFYGKAIKTNGGYEPAQQNMRRIYELYTFGASREPVALGDEDQFVLSGLLKSGGPR